MNKALYLTISLFLINICSAFSQVGKIYLKNPEFKLGQENIYIYEPPKGLIVPENAKVKIEHISLEFLRSIFLLKKQETYEFSLKVPKEANVLFFAIFNKQDSLIDNNAKKGYIFYPKNNTKEEIEKVNVEKWLLSYVLTSHFKLSTSSEEIIKQIEIIYKQNPILKNEDLYREFLFLKYSKQANKVEIIKYIEDLERKGDEKSLNNALHCYRRLGQKYENKSKELQALILRKYPQGRIAKIVFIEELNRKVIDFDRDSTEQNAKYILDTYQIYINKFQDYSANSRDKFYLQLVDLYLDNEDTLKIFEYANQIGNSHLIHLGYKYNGFAESITEKRRDDTLSNETLIFAEKLSKKSLEIIEKYINEPESYDYDFVEILPFIYNEFVETYASILFQHNKFSIAFQYLDTVKNPYELTSKGKELYALCAEKYKGLTFTKNYLEKEFIEGTISDYMFKQYKDICKQLNIKDTEYEKIRLIYLKNRIEGIKREILATYKSEKAPNFSLYDTKGKLVKLSDYKGKIVLLNIQEICDYCGSDSEEMLTLADKYDNIKFIFIYDKRLTEWMMSYGDKISVLLDPEKLITKQYKLDKYDLPTQIIIDKEGNILYKISNLDDDNNLLLFLDMMYGKLE